MPTYYTITKQVVAVDPGVTITAQDYSTDGGSNWTPIPDVMYVPSGFTAKYRMTVNNPNGLQLYRYIQAYIHKIAEVSGTMTTRTLTSTSYNHNGNFTLVLSATAP